MIVMPDVTTSTGSSYSMANTAMGNDNLWNRLLNAIQGRINRQNFDVWFSKIRLLEVGQDELCLEVPSRHFQDWILDNYEGLIVSELERLSGQRFRLRFFTPTEAPATSRTDGVDSGVGRESAEGYAGAIVDGAGANSQRFGASNGVSSSPSGSSSAAAFGSPSTAAFSSPSTAAFGSSSTIAFGSMGLTEEFRAGDPRARETGASSVVDGISPVESSSSQSTFALNPAQVFASYVVGSSNQFAHAGALAVANNPAKTYNPLFLFGTVGLGKTHLLNAIGNKILADNPNARVLYLSCEQFVNEMINSLQEHRMNEFRNKFRDTCDALLVDDIQFLAGKVRTQEEFFYTFNALHSSGKQIVVTSDKFPRDIPGLEERLRNRFEWGLIADIQPPDLETKVAILKKKAIREDLHIPDDVAMYIAQNSKSNIRELEGILVRLTAASSFYQRQIDLPFAQLTLKDILEGARPSLTVETIQEQVGRYFEIDLKDLKGKRKNKQLVWPRQIAMYLCRKHTSSSFPELGQKFGGKDHTTIIHAVNKIEEAIAQDPEVAQEVKLVEKSLGL